MTQLKDLPEEEAIEIFKVWLKGGAIEHYRTVSVHPAKLTKTSHYSTKKTPDEIDWSHVSPKYKFMARDNDGNAWLYTDMPNLDEGRWLTPRNGQLYGTPAFTSYKRGTVDWRDSLVERPSFKEGY